MKFEIKKDKPAPRNEQETIINYDKETDTWHFYSNNPVHCRRWESAILPSDTLPSFKVHHQETGTLIGLDGKIDGSVSVRKKREYSEEERKALSDRMRGLQEDKAEAE